MLTGWTAAEARFRRCTFVECRFVACDLTMAKLYDSRFRGVRFERCKLMGVDFDPTRTRLGKTKMSLEGVLAVAQHVGIVPELG